jgi:hypothetical protein
MNAPYETEVVGLISQMSLPPLRLRVVTGEEEARRDADLVLEASGPGLESTRFAADYQRIGTPRLLNFAVANVRRQAERAGLLPLVITPFLSEEGLLGLEAQGVSGLDLCGNGLMVVPGRYTVFRTGKPNRFSTTTTLKNVYRGAASLVARAFLLRPDYPTVNTAVEFLRERGGDVSRATVAKALRGLEDDLIIGRDTRGRESALTLLQPEKLLSLLESNWTKPTSRREARGRVALSSGETRQAITRLCVESGGAVVASGVSSAGQYATVTPDEETTLYCASLERVRDALPFTATTRFPNLRIIETDDPTPFFDPRPDADGYPWASPIQAYLEMANDEPRLKQSASATRDLLLSGTNQEGTP